MDILNWLYLAKNRFVRTTPGSLQDLMIFGSKVGFTKRGDKYQNYAMEIGEFAQILPAGPAGPQGVAGNTGPAGPIGPVGPAGLNWQGAWSPLGVYAIDDAVGYGGASWFCIDPVGPSATTPDTDPTNWALLASQGAQGIQGLTGLQGPTGATGPSGATMLLTTNNPGGAASFIAGTLNVPVYQTNIPHLEWDNTNKTIWNNGSGNQSGNTCFGQGSLESNTTGAGNTAIGALTLSDNVVGAANTAIGYYALGKNIDSENTAIGTYSLYYNTNGNQNTAVGSVSLFSNTFGVNNVAIGNTTVQYNTTGSDNTVVGNECFNTLGIANTTGSSNTAIGSNTESGNFSGSVIIGRNATATASNQFVVGSVTYNAGVVAAEVNTSANVWNVVINGVPRKILLA